MKTVPGGGPLGLGTCPGPGPLHAGGQRWPPEPQSQPGLKLGSSDCNKAMRGIQAFAVELNNSPHCLPSTLAMARRQEEVECLAAGAPLASWGPNPRHPATQVP
jgi:hypothetical protein